MLGRKDITVFVATQICRGDSCMCLWREGVLPMPSSMLSSPLAKRGTMWWCVWFNAISVYLCAENGADVLVRFCFEVYHFYP